MASPPNLKDENVGGGGERCTAPFQPNKLKSVGLH